MKKITLHIARDGQVLGTVEGEKITDYLDSGYLLKSDYYFDEAADEWLPITQYKTPAPTLSAAPDTRPASTRSEGSSGSVAPDLPGSSGKGAPRGGRSRKRDQKQTLASVAGWVACLFALVLGAGIWAWSQTIADRLALYEGDNQTLKVQIERLKRDNQALTEITPPMHVRGVVAYQMSSDQVGISSGITVAVYPRDVIEKSLSQIMQSGYGDGFQGQIEGWRTLLPSPSQVTMTDANGRFDVTLPDTKPYVLVTSSNRQTGSGSSVSVWLIGVTATEDPTPLMLLNERNAITAEEPQLTIKEVTPFVPGGRK